jgi:DNA-directed RNA polymerase subunit RPC12/RpoP
MFYKKYVCSKCKTKVKIPTGLGHPRYAPPQCPACGEAMFIKKCRRKQNKTK